MESAHSADYDGDQDDDGEVFVYIDGPRRPVSRVVDPVSFGSLNSSN